MSLSGFKITKKLVFVLIGVVLFAELVWAGIMLTKNKTPSSGTVSVNNPLPRAAVRNVSSLSLTAPKNSFKVGEDIAVQVNISSDKPTDGADIIIIYDPKKLSVVPGQGKLPVTVGNIYSDYPLNKADETMGSVLVSGITSKPGGVIPKGVFGNFTFRAKSVGQTKISFDYTPGSTIDSNVIEAKSAKDILNSVSNLELNILP